PLTEGLPGGGGADFEGAIAGTERLAAEHAAARAAVHEIPAAREHRNLSSHLAYLDRASRFVNARLTCGASALWHPVERLLRVRAIVRRLFRCDARRVVCGKLTTPRRNLVIPTNLAVIGPWFPPPVRGRTPGWGECECLPSTVLGARAARIASVAARAKSRLAARAWRCGCSPPG